MSKDEFLNLIYRHHGKTILSKKETARELGGISTETLDRLRADGEISSKKIRGQIMFTGTEIYRYLSGL